MIFQSIDPPSPDSGEGETRAQGASSAPAKAESSGALRTGVYLGGLLNLVMMAALVTANRFPNLEPYALERNAASYGLFVVFLLIPVVRFLNRPVQMFTAGLVGWVLFVAGYRIAGMFFHSLFNVLRRTPFEALIEGAILYGIIAVVSWVVGMILEATRRPLAPRRRPAHRVVRHRP
jgi:uncharacterized membrane protein YvlD (DUF360 family)